MENTNTTEKYNKENAKKVRGKEENFKFKRRYRKIKTICR